MGSKCHHRQWEFNSGFKRSQCESKRDPLQQDSPASPCEEKDRHDTGFVPCGSDRPMKATASPLPAPIWLVPAGHQNAFQLAQVGTLVLAATSPGTAEHTRSFPGSRDSGCCCLAREIRQLKEGRRNETFPFCPETSDITTRQAPHSNLRWNLKPLSVFTAPKCLPFLPKAEVTAAAKKMPNPPRLVH